MISIEEERNMSDLNFRHSWMARHKRRNEGTIEEMRGGREGGREERIVSLENTLYGRVTLIAQEK